MTQTPIISIENISVAIHKKNILNDISCTVQEGEVLVLLGSNGSGKSTLLKTIAGLYPLQKGNIQIQNKNIQQWKRTDFAKNISYFPQSQVAPYDLTIFDYVSLGRYPFTGLLPILSEEDQEKINTQLKNADLLSMAYKKLNELSGGELQRVYIARTLVTEAKILLLDEPTNSLDIKKQREFLELIQTIKKQNYTIVIAMHSIDLALYLADKILLLKSGATVLFDTPQNPKIIDYLTTTFDVPISLKPQYDFERPDIEENMPLN